MMDKDDERMMYAMGALIGLVMRGEAPSIAAQQMWQYADFAVNYKEFSNEEN